MRKEWLSVFNEGYTVIVEKNEAFDTQNKLEFF